MVRLLIEREDEEASGRLQSFTPGEEEGPTVMEEIVPAESVVLESTDYNISPVENPTNTITTIIQTIVETT